MILYCLFNILIPVIILFSFPILLILIIIPNFEITSINLLLVTMELKKNAQISECVQYSFSIYIIFSLFFILLKFIRKLNNDVELLKGNIYGTDKYLFYKIAKLLGFKKIDLKMKPYFIIFKVILNDDFDIINLEKENKAKSDKIKIEVDNSKFDNIKNNLRECNLIISDTYDIEINQLPLDKQEISTIEVRRINEKNIRISSDELVDQVRKSVIKIKETGAKINLFMTTSTYNTYQIVNSCFKVGNRDLYDVEIFQQNTKTKKFNPKGKVILRNKNV